MMNAEVMKELVALAEMDPRAKKVLTVYAKTPAKVLAILAQLDESASVREVADSLMECI